MFIPHKVIYTFGEYRLDAKRRRLWRGDQPVTLSSKVFDLLLALVREQGRILSKQELINLVWPDSLAEDSNLAVSVSTLRRALGEKSGENRFITTVPGQGYQFVAEVRAEETDEDSLPVERPAISEMLAEPAISEMVVKEETAALPFVASARELPSVIAPPLRRSHSRLLVIGGAFAMAVLLGLALWFKYASAPLRASDVRSLAVLPFKPLTGADSDKTLGLGLADALITYLGSTGQIMVRPTSAILKYTALDASLVTIGGELGVEAVLDGRVQQVGDRLRLTVQLVRAADDMPLWAESFDEQFTNLLAVQKTISEKVARALTLKLTAEQQRRLVKDYTANTEAFQAYLRGRYFEFQRVPDQFLQKAIEQYEHAIALDPAYALAYAGISNCYYRLSLPPFQMGEPPQAEFFAKAKAAAHKAAELDPGLSDAHTALGTVLVYEDDAAGHREYNRALELNPNDAQAYLSYAYHHLADGRLEEALDKLKRAVVIDPLSANLNTTLGVTLYRLHRYEESLARLKQTVKLDPNLFRTHWALGLVYTQMGQHEAAITALQRAVELSNNGPLMQAALGFGYATAGRRAEADQVLEQIRQVQPPRRGTAYWVAAVHLGLGDRDRAFEWLEKARQEGAYRLIIIDPIFDSLRADPRYAALLRLQ
jgi:DNA-binding winged helix-turn-helix (wHTH) protein/TolB-like protein/Flp pilus assembly protein TadD